MINVVILAAGQGKRMHSRLPKVLQPLAGKPMIEHVLDTVATLGDVAKTIVVVGHLAPLVQESLKTTLTCSSFFKSRNSEPGMRCNRPCRVWICRPSKRLFCKGMFR